MAALDPAWLDELSELLRIPSLSADPGHADDVRRAAEWVRDFVRRAGGEAEVVDWEGRPLVLGEMRASNGADPAKVVAHPLGRHVDVGDVRRIRAHARDAQERRELLQPGLLHGRSLA